MTTRRLAAILTADVVGFSKLMGIDEEGTLARVKALRRDLIEPKVQEHHGRLVKTTGDGVLIEFASPVEAVRCAVSLQEALSSEAAQANAALQIRIGINVGDIIIDDDGDIYGDGVNVAARLEQLADPGGVCLSGKVYEEVRDKLDLSFEDRGEQQVKNIARPVRVWALKRSPCPTHDSSSEHRTLSLPDKPSIAVLPFTNMSGDPEQEYFADGVVEDIITNLDVKQIGRELGVRYVLEGAIRKANQRVRITGQLIDAATGSHLWAERFDGGLEDIFQLQDDISATVANAIGPKLEQVETERARRKPTLSLTAYDLELRARAVYDGQDWRAEGGPTKVEESHSLLLDALRIDPEFAPAYASAAFSFCIRKANSWVLDEGTEAEQAAHFARAAARFGPDDPASLCKAGHALAYVAGDLDGGSSYADRALTLAPTHAIANLYGAFVCIWRGDTDLAIARLTRAMRLSPLDPMAFAMQGVMAHAHFHAERYEEAVRWAQAALSDRPQDSTATRILAASYGMLGTSENANRAVERLMQIDPILRVSKLQRVLGPYRPEALARYEDGLRRAGLPD